MAWQVPAIGSIRAKLAVPVLALVAFFAADLTAVNRGMGVAASETPPAGAEPDAANGEGLLDMEADLPELQKFAQSGPNDVRDITIVENGFLIATGAAIVRYRYSGDTPKATSVYTSQHGLPTGNCYLLRRDANGGVWAHCQGGVGYLAPRADRWQTFTAKNGLAAGNATNLALSADGNRVWVSSTGGLSTALVKDGTWQVFQAKNLTDLLVHPTEDVVWCRRLIRSRCMCGRQVLTSQFDLKSRTWRDIPESGNCPHVAPTPTCFSVADGMLWMSGGYDPPMLYDPRENTTRTWPKEPNWERNNYFDWFGAMAPAMNGETGAWFATNAGLWRFDSQKDQWQGHLRNDDPGCGQPLLVRGNGGKTLYWACEGTVAAYDVANDKWTDLWHVSDESRRAGQHSLTLSPDERLLWLIGLGGIMVGEPASRKAITLDDADQPGLTAAKFVRFDPSKRLALIATPQGVVCADYDGKLKFALTRPAPPILHRVSRFAFAPDGSEVWCLMKDKSGFVKPAAVLHPGKNHWEVVPDPKTSAQFFCVAFARDGETVWLSRARGDDAEGHGIVQRRPGTLGWEEVSVNMPVYFGDVDHLWLAPRGDEIWMGTRGHGLLRAKLASNETTYYGEQRSRAIGPSVEEDHALTGDFISDLVFAKRGKCVVCSSGVGGKTGITQIDLDTGKSSSYGTPSIVQKLVASPDDRTMWCIFNNYDSLLWAFDVQTRSWTHKCSTKEGMLHYFIQTLECSPDGAFVWLRGTEGVAVYSVREKSWRGFVGEQWSSDIDCASLWVTSDGKHVVCGHRQGIALMKIDGGDYAVLSPGADIKDCLVSRIVPIPRTSDYVCSVSHPEAGGLYHVDIGHRSLRKLKDMRNSTVTAMAIGPDGFLWGAVPGSVFCVNPQTGQDRAGLEALQFGEPTTTLLRHDGKLDSSRVVVAPRSALKGRVMPRPERVPSRPPATSLQNKGMVWTSTHLPTIATSKSGSTYITWFAHPRESALVKGGLPQIPDALLPADRDRDGATGTSVRDRILRLHSILGKGAATGISVHDGQKWLPAQLLARGPKHCDVRFAWCQQDDLHVLIETSENERLYHLSYRPATQTWTKLNVLDHHGTTFCAQDGTVHLACFDYDRRRVCYRLYDGKEWSKPVWFDAKSDFDGLAVAVGGDGAGHVVWRDGGAHVAHASVKDGRAEYSRQDLADRPIVGREFAVSTAPDGSLMMAYCAELYEGHPDRDYAHIRTWDGRSWSEATVIPFDTAGFHSPTFVRHGNAILLSWVGRSPVVRVFSVLTSDGGWSYPLPLCSAQDDKLRCDYFVSLSADHTGRVHAAWCVEEETYTAIVTSLGE